MFQVNILHDKIDINKKVWRLDAKISSSYYMYYQFLNILDSLVYYSIILFPLNTLIIIILTKIIVLIRYLLNDRLFVVC